MRKALLLLAAVLPIPGLAEEDAAPRRQVLVELFTSQG